MHVYVWEHTVIAVFYRIARWMLTKLGRDEVLMAPQMRLEVSVISTQGRIKGRAKIGQGGPFIKKKTSFSDRKATPTNRRYRNDLEAFGDEVLLFLVLYRCCHRTREQMTP